MRVVVVINDRKYEGWALRAGHHVTQTEWDHDAQTMTVWVEKGEGYVEPTSQFVYTEDLD